MTSRRNWLRQALSVGGVVLLAGCDRLPTRLPFISPPYQVGVLTSSTIWLDNLKMGLRSLGYAENQNMVLEVRSAEGRVELLPDMARDLVNLPVDVIAVAGVPAMRAAIEAARGPRLPIVMVAGGDDPVALGFVESLARPGGNVTGLTDGAEQLTAKRLELLHEAVPGDARIGVLNTPATTPSQWQEAQAAAAGLNLGLELLEVPGPDEIEQAFVRAREQRLRAMLLLLDPVTVQNQVRLGQLALQHTLPAMHSMGAFVNAGGLLAYGPNINDLARRAATYVDKIARGAKPADLPIEQATTFDLIVNLKSALALGVTLPPTLMAQATAVIQ